MEKKPSRVVRVTELGWRRLADISTAAWLWSLIPSGAASVIAGWLAYGEGLPRATVLLIALAALALVMFILAFWRAWRDDAAMLAQPNLADYARERSLRNKAEVVADMATGSYRRPDDGSEAFRKNELDMARTRERTGKKPAEWAPLHQALHWLVYESRWGEKQPAVETEDEFNRVVSAEVRERIARGDIASRGQLGWDEQSRGRATEPIPANYWIDAYFLPFASIALAGDGGDEIAKQGGGGSVYRGVILRWSDIKVTWKRGTAPKGQLPPLAAFVESPRAKIAAEKRSRGAGGILAAMDDELAEQEEKTWQRLAAVLPVDKVQRLRAGRYRDASLAEALGWIVYGEWERPWRGTPAAAAFAAGLGIGENIYDLLAELGKRAGEGRLTIWGKESSAGVWKVIPQDHWQDHELTLADTFGSITTGEDGYRDLMLNRAEVEREWPHEG